MGLAHQFGRRRFLTSLGGLSAVALLAACGAQPEATPPPSNQSGGSAASPTTKTDATAPGTPASSAKPGSSGTVILRLHARSGPEDDMWAAILPKFGAENNAEVQLEQVPGSEHIQKIQTLAAGDQLGDVIHVFTGDSSFQMFFSSGVLVSLDEHISADNYDLNQYYKFCADGCTVDGKYGGLPFKGHPSRCGIFYNKDLFDAAGVSVPTNDSTYDDLVAAAQKLHKQSGSDVATYGWTNPGANDQEWYIILSRFGGGDLFTQDGKQSRLNEPDAQWGWTWTYDMMNTHKVMLNPLQTNPPVSDLFVSGKLAMARLNIGTKAAFAAIDSFQWGMSVAPKGPKGQRGTLAATDVVGLTKFSKNPDLGWTLLKYITSKEAGIALGMQSGGGRSATPGARPDVYESDEVLKLPFPAGVQENTMIAMQEVEPYIQPDNFRGPEIMRAINPMYESLILNNSQPDQKFFGELNLIVQDILDKQRP